MLRVTELAPMAYAHDANGKIPAGVMPFISSGLHCAMRPAHDQVKDTGPNLAGTHDPGSGWNIGKVVIIIATNHVDLRLGFALALKLVHCPFPRPRHKYKIGSWGMPAATRHARMLATEDVWSSSTMPFSNGCTESPRSSVNAS